MPYIDPKDRVKLEDWLPMGVMRPNAGNLNYTITQLLLLYVEAKGESYQTFNDISGAMTECLAEFRRRKIVPYEDKKIQSNGDVY